MIYAFDDFELDEERFELRHRGVVVPVQARVWKTIAHLIEQRARVVSKAELLETVWAGTAVSETAISQVIMLARKALQDESEQQQIIKTIRGRGFRFVAEVQVRPEPRAAPAASSTAPAAPSASPLPSTNAPQALIGRDAELTELVQRVTEAERGQGTLLLIEGEPGIGKSTLVAELAKRAGARGLPLLWGKAWEEGGAPPFWPWVQVLRGLAERLGPAASHGALGEAFDQLRALAPEIGGAAPSQDARPISEADGARARFRLFDAMARLLRALAGSGARGTESGPSARPWVIILEDLHAVDHASVQLLRFVSQDLDGLSLLIVGTFRDLELAGHGTLAALVSGLAPAQRMKLHGLSRPQVELLVEQRLGRSPAPPFTEAVQQLSGGNPLLVGELARPHVACDGAIDLSTLAAFALPERIAEAVRRQLAELPEATRDALATASALGREFALPLLAALLECDEPALLERLAPALRRGLVHAAPNASARLIFSHATVCNAIYSGQTPTRRIALHRRVAELLEATHPAERLPLYEIAHHYHLAAAGGARDKAIEYAKRAADQAWVMQAYEAAAGLLDRAHALAELGGHDGASLHELLIGAGDAWYRASDIVRATARFDLAADRARAENSPDRYIWAVLMATFVVRATLLHDRARQEQLRLALSMMPPGDSIPNAMLLGASMLSMRAPEALPERLAISQRAVDMARRLNDPFALEWSLNVQHFGLWGAAHPSQLLQVAEELVTLCTATQNEELKLDALMWRLSDHTELGNLPAALRDLEQYLSLAERTHDPLHRYMALAAECFSRSSRGDYARARELSELSLQLGRRVQEPLTDAFYAVRRLFFAFDCDTPAPAVMAEDPPECVPPEHRVFWALGWARCHRIADARRVLSTYASTGFDRVLLDGLRRPTLATLGELCVLLDDAKSGEQVYRLLLPYADLHLLLQAAVYMGPVSYYLGRLAVTLGREREAEQHFETAMAQCDSAEVRPYYVRAQYALARLLAMRPDTRKRGGELLEKAQLEARNLGMAEIEPRAAITAA